MIKPGLRPSMGEEDSKLRLIIQPVSQLLVVTALAFLNKDQSTLLWGSSLLNNPLSHSPFYLGQRSVAFKVTEHFKVYSHLLQHTFL